MEKEYPTWHFQDGLSYCDAHGVHICPDCLAETNRIEKDKQKEQAHYEAVRELFLKNSHGVYVDLENMQNDWDYCEKIINFANSKRPK